VKDLATLIAAARLVHVRLPAAQFVIVGEGPLCGQLQQQVSQASLTGVVRLVGLQSDVLPYLASADVGVLTSHSEGSSNSVLEYMAMGLPTVVSDIPPNRELVEGVFFVPGDVASLAEALVELWRDPPTIQRLAERNHRAALQYGVEELVRRAEGYYNRLVPATY
jgi:glycosyltransferase involved in cell wall biosynthesis